jgi:Mor family transcriptional regulator
MNDDVIEQLAMLLGSEKAGEVATFFSGESIYIPKRSVIRKRHALIRAEYHTGASYQELALRYGYTEKHIRNIVNKKYKS